MTVKELIEALKQFPPDLRVGYYDECSECEVNECTMLTHAASYDDVLFSAFNDGEKYVVLH